jgi:hypothetical protein
MHINKKIKAATENALSGFAPAPAVPPNAIAPEPGNRLVSHAQGWVKEGTVPVPSFILGGRYYLITKMIF